MDRTTVIAAAILLAAVTVGSGHAAESPLAGQKGEVADGDRSAAATAGSGVAEVPAAKLFPTEDPAAGRSSDVMVDGSPPSRRGAFGMQHEFHGGVTTFMGVTNGVNR